MNDRNEFTWSAERNVRLGRLIPDSSAVEWLGDDQIPMVEENDRIVIVSPIRGGTSYSPLRDRVLFKRFADVDLDPASICEFAQRFGLLGFRRLSVVPPEGVDIFMSPAEGIYGWYQEIVRLRWCIKIWELLTRRRPPDWRTVFSMTSDPDTLTCTLPVSDPVPFPTAWLSNFGTVSSWEIDEFILGVGGAGAKAAPLIFLSAMIREGLRERVSPFVMPVGTSLRLEYKPETLLGAIWLQFAQAMTAGARFRACDGCGEWMELSPRSFRSQAKHCSPRCRQRVYVVKRQKDATLANGLHKKGIPVRQIAREMNVSVRKVRTLLREAES